MSLRLDLSDGLAGRGDEVYEALIRAHEGLTEEQSAALNVRLVLVLANQVRDPDAVIEAIRWACDLPFRSTPPA